MLFLNVNVRVGLSQFRNLNTDAYDAKQISEELMHGGVYDAGLMDKGVNEGIFNKYSLDREQMFAGIYSKPKSIRGTIGTSFNFDANLMAEGIFRSLRNLSIYWDGRKFRSVRSDHDIDRHSTNAQVCYIVTVKFITYFLKCSMFILQCENHIEALERYFIRGLQIPKPLLEIMRLAHWSKGPLSVNDIHKDTVSMRRDDVKMHVRTRSEEDSLEYDSIAGWHIKQIKTVDFDEFMECLAELNRICIECLGTEMVDINYNEIQTLYRDKPDLFLSLINEGVEQREMPYHKIRVNERTGRSCVMESIVYGIKYDISKIDPFFIEAQPQYFDSDLIGEYATQWVSRVWTGDSQRTKPVHNGFSNRNNLPFGGSKRITNHETSSRSDATRFAKFGKTDTEAARQEQSEELTNISLRKAESIAGQDLATKFQANTVNEQSNARDKLKMHNKARMEKKNRSKGAKTEKT